MGSRLSRVCLSAHCSINVGTSSVGFVRESQISGVTEGDLRAKEVWFGDVSVILADWSRNDARNRLFTSSPPWWGLFFFSLPCCEPPPVHFLNLLPILQVAKRFPLAKLVCIHFNARLYTSCWPLCTIPGPLLHRSLGRYCFKRESSDCALWSAFIIKSAEGQNIFINVDLCCLALMNARKLLLLMGSH